MTGIRYDFDPYGRAQSYVEDWEREFEAANLRALAREARKAQQSKSQQERASAGLWVRLSRRARLTRGLAPRVRPVQ